MGKEPEIINNVKSGKQENLEHTGPKLETTKRHNW